MFELKAFLASANQEWAEQVQTTGHVCIPHVVNTYYELVTDFAMTDWCYNALPHLCYVQMALKCADISNQTQLWDLCQNWSLRIMEEFFKQGDTERGLQLPTSSFLW